MSDHNKIIYAYKFTFPIKERCIDEWISRLLNGKYFGNLKYMLI